MRWIQVYHMASWSLHKGREVKVKVAQLCRTLCNPMDYSPWNSPGQNTGIGSLFLLQGIFPNQKLNWGPRHWRWILWAIREVAQRKLTSKDERCWNLEGSWALWRKEHFRWNITCGQNMEAKLNETCGEAWIVNMQKSRIWREVREEIELRMEV